MSDEARHYDLMRELMEIPGPTGQESRVMAWLRERWGGQVERLWTAKGGNLFAHVGGKGPRLLIEGHADEIGFVVRSVDERGFVWLASGQAPRGDVGRRYPVGQPALVLGRGAPVEGLFATTSGHILTEQQRQKPNLDFYDLFVDVGAESREEVYARDVYPGAGVIWNPTTRRQGNRVTGKAVDDRFALALMTLLLERLDRSALAYDLYLAATIQEEIGLVGATSLRSEVDADLAIALDNGPVGDIPTVDRRSLPTRVGGGPALVHKDSRTHYNEELTWRIIAVAERAGIPYQHAVWEFFGSDGDALIQQGIPAALIGLSTRYTHSPFETFDLRDFDAALRLVAAFVTTRE
ncbi:MAG TPA: M20/M25/M40 family metallo-hydrolase [Thermomicrobiaceae bacterium]|nr:M20/M25/M40 family metallo-hydrolase [Thermomicrobiaceae bacterium]